MTGIRHQAKESLLRSRDLHSLQREYKAKYGDISAVHAELACKLFEQPYLNANAAKELLDVTSPTAYRAIDQLEDAGVLEQITEKKRNREYRAREIFEILELPPRTY